MRETNFDQEILREAKAIVLKGLKGSKARVYLFGSRAHGKVWPSSDLDIGVLPLEPLPQGLLSKIREDLEESHIPYKVDLIDLSRTDVTFQEKVKNEGILWSD